MRFFGRTLGQLYRSESRGLRHRNPSLDGERCGMFYRDENNILRPYNLVGDAAADCVAGGNLFRDDNGVLRTSAVYACDDTPSACDPCVTTPDTWDVTVIGGVDFLGVNDEFGCNSCSHTDMLLAQFNGTYTLTRSTPTGCRWDFTQTLEGPFSKTYVHNKFDPTGCPGNLGIAVCDSVSKSRCPCACATRVCPPTCGCCNQTTQRCSLGCICCCPSGCCSDEPCAVCSINCPDPPCCFNHYPPSGPPFMTETDSPVGIMSLSLTVFGGSNPHYQFTFSPNLLNHMTLTPPGPPENALVVDVPITDGDCNAFGAGPFYVYRCCGADTCAILVSTFFAIVLPG